MAGKRRWILGTGVALVLLAVGGTAWLLPDLKRMAAVGAGFVARQGCSCVFVAGRGLEACRADMLPEMERIRAELVDGPDGPGLRAWVPLLADRTALFRDLQSGCTLQ